MTCVNGCGLCKIALGLESQDQMPGFQMSRNVEECLFFWYRYHRDLKNIGSITY